MGEKKLNIYERLTFTILHLPVETKIGEVFLMMSIIALRRELFTEITIRHDKAYATSNIARVFCFNYVNIIEVKRSLVIFYFNI